MLNNVFLEFLSRDSQEFHGLTTDPTRMKRNRLLSEALNAAVFLCSEYCIVPPSFFVESQLTRELLLQNSDYLGERLIRMPLREKSLEEFWEKKEREYAAVKKAYPDVFDKYKQNYLKRYSDALVPRNFNVGDSIVDAWEAGPDIDDAWKSIRDEIAGADLELLRKVPGHIRDSGLAVTWPAIKAAIKRPVGVDPTKLHYILQHHYLSVYIRSLGLRIVTRLPLSRVDFLLGEEGLCYDYDALKSALDPIKLLRLIKTISPQSLIELRKKSGFLVFRDMFDQIALVAPNAHSILRAFARAEDHLRDCCQLPPVVTNPPRKIHRMELSDDDLNMVAAKLGQAARFAWEHVQDESALAETAANGSFDRRTRMKAGDKQPSIAVFVALDEERKFLVKRWKLKNTYAERGIWRGELPTAKVMLFSSARMGRVSAAVATMEFLSSLEKPDLLIVMGIAGGIKRNGVNRGDVLVPEMIVDLATRKIRQNLEKIEFRPKEFTLDDRIPSFLRSGNFDEGEWGKSVLEDAEWPQGVRPTIRHGPVASLDEVVSSTSWIKKLCDAWPKLDGVEMEAGGVCAAAERFNVRPAVIRGVSDHANPLKSDDNWRIISMKTAAHLLERVDFKTILQDT